MRLASCSYLNESAFYGCSALKTVDMPMCSSIAPYAFLSCYSLQSVSLPVCGSINLSAFKYCSALQDISLPKCHHLMYGAFMYCISLKTITIGTELSTVCYLDYSDVFYSCSALQSIYVPLSLVNAYKSASYWSYYSDKIKGI